MSLNYSAEARLRDALLNAGIPNPGPLIDGFREETRADYALTEANIKEVKAEAWDEGYDARKHEAAQNPPMGFPGHRTPANPHRTVKDN